MESRSALLLACLLFSTLPAAGDAALAAPASAGEGQVYVYLQPAAFDAEAVSFAIDTISAIDERGADVPLDVTLRALGRDEYRRQRLLASRSLPAGPFTGLSIRVSKAWVRDDRGEAALSVPDAAFRVNAPFVVARGKAVVLWLELRHAPRAAPDTPFGPEFAAYVAPRPMVSLAGFVSSPASDAVVVFDKRRRQAAAVIPVPGHPSGLALDQRAGRLYVACPRTDEILAIDVASAEVVEQVRLFPGDGPRELALTPDGRTLLSVNPGSNSVTVFDAQPLTRLERIDVGSGPGSIAVEPAGRRAFVFDTLSGSISVIDLARASLAATLAVDASPSRGQFNARGDRLFVIHDRSPYATVVDPRQLAVLTRARLRTAASAIRMDGRRGLLYLAGPTSPTVDVYDTNTLLPVDFLKVPAGAAHLAIDADENHLYLTSPGTNRLTVSNLADRKVVSEIDLVQGPYWVAVMGEK